MINIKCHKSYTKLYPSVHRLWSVVKFFSQDHVFKNNIKYVFRCKFKCRSCLSTTCFLCDCVYFFSAWHKQDPQLRKHLHLACEQIYGAFSWLMIDVEESTHCGRCYIWAGGPRCSSKQAWGASQEAEFLQGFGFSVRLQVLLRSRPDFHQWCSMTGLCKANKLFPPKFITATGEQTRVVTEKMFPQIPMLKLLFSKWYSLRPQGCSAPGDDSKLWSSPLLLR